MWTSRTRCGASARTAMTTLADLIPDPELLLALPPEQVGKQLLRLAAEYDQNGVIAFDLFTGEALTNYSTSQFGGGGARYPAKWARQLELAVAEARWWLELAMLIVPAEGINGRNGFKRISRKGRELLRDDAAFETYVAASAFPKSMLHPAIADEVWLQLSQGKLDVAVFVAFRQVEIAVRVAGLVTVLCRSPISLCHLGFERERADAAQI